MGKNVRTTRLVDEVIRYAALSGMLTAVILAPNAVKALDKPLRALDKKLDTRQREREAQRIVRYMKQKGYLSGDYEHGLQLTTKAKKRLKQIELQEIQIHMPEKWDKIWRIVVYDIPEIKRYARHQLSTGLRRLGCHQLQRSTWVTPFPCRDEISAVAAHFAVDTFISYFEVIKLDNEEVLVKRFKEKYPAVFA